MIPTKSALSPDPTSRMLRAILLGVAMTAIVIAGTELIELIISRFAAKHGPQLGKDTSEYLGVRDATADFLSTLLDRATSEREHGRSHGKG